MTNKRGKLRKVGVIAKILDKEGLLNLGFNIPVEGKVTAQQVIMLNRKEEEMPSISDVAKANDIKLQNILENAVKSTENLIEQLDGESPEDLPMRKFLSLDKQLRSISSLLKVEVSKKVELQQCTEQEKCKLEEIHDNPEYVDGIREDIRK